MKITKILFLSAVLIRPAAFADTSHENLQTVYEVFSLTKSEAAQSQREGLNDSKIYARMLEGLKTGKVKQEKLLAVRTSSGRNSSTMHISEFIYATEYEPAELPNAVGVDESAFGPEVKNGEKLKSLKSGSGWQAGSFPATPAMPATFETKYLGDTLEVEVSLNQASYINLRFFPRHTRLLKMDTWGQGLSETQMPRFDSSRLKGTVVLKSGTPTLVGTMTPAPEAQPKDAEERVWFAFITATVVKVDQ